MNSNIANAKSRQTTYETPPGAGYVVHDSEVVWGIGATEEEAWCDAWGNFERGDHLDPWPALCEEVRFDLEMEHGGEDDYDAEADARYWPCIERAVRAYWRDQLECVEATAAGMREEHPHLMGDIAGSREEYFAHEEAQEEVRRARRRVAAVALNLLTL